MKKTLLVLAVELLFSCKKDQMSDFKNEIEGTWELQKVTGFVSYTLPPDNGKIIVLGEDGSFERKQHDTLIFQGYYTLQKKNDCYERSTNTIFYSNESNPSDYNYIELMEGKLSLSTPNCYMDGGTAYYRRIN